MMIFLKFFIFLVFLIAFCEQSAKRLHKHLFSNYDSRSRPVENPQTITNVCVDLYLLQIVRINEKNQVIEINMQLAYSWNDTLLKWNQDEFENISQVFVNASKIWTPDLVIMNLAEENATRDLRRNGADYLMILKNTGRVKWQFHTVSKSFCRIDIMEFPFDTQVCSIKIKSSSRDMTQVVLKRRNQRVKLRFKIDTEWFLLNSSVTENYLKMSENFGGNEYTVLEFKMTIRRRFTYYMIKIIFPFTIISFITIFTFCLQPDSGEKLTLDVTILLSLVFYLNIMSDHIPRGYSKTPILTLYALSNFTLVFLSCSFTVFILRLYYRPPLIKSLEKNHSFNHLPRLIRTFLFEYLAPFLFVKVNYSNEKISNSIDIKPVKSKAENENESYERECMKMLNNLRNFNQAITGKVSSNRLIIEEKNRIFEEWKNAALILDRFLFVIFLILTPSTVLIFFTRTNILDYLFSSRELTNDSVNNTAFCN